MLRQRIRLLVVLAVLGAGLGVAVAVLLPAQYSANATVLVSPLEGNPYSPEGRGDDLVNLETEAQLVGTDAVARIAQQRLKGSDLGKLRSQVSVSVPPNTQVLNITYTAASAGDARAGSSAFAEAYLEFRRQRAQSVLNGRIQKLKDQSATVEARLRAATQKLAGASGSQRTYFTQRITAYTNQLGVIDEQSNDISSTPISPGQVINPATAPSGAAVMRMVIFGAGGLPAGLALGVFLVWLRQRLDQRLRVPEQIEALGLRLLSTIPDEPAEAGGGVLALVDTPKSAPKSATGEAYRRLRSGLVAHIPETPVSLLVASATPGGTAAATATNLAVALAFAGSKTIMIDATAHGLDPAGLFGVRPGKGLSEALLTGADPAAMLIHADPQLRLLPRGSDAAASGHRFSGPRMRTTVETLGGRADFLLINSPSVHDADAQALCTLVDKVILVVHRGLTTRDQLEQARTEAIHAGADVVGVVLESGPPRTAAPVAPAVPSGDETVALPRQPARRPSRTGRRPAPPTGYDQFSEEAPARAEPAPQQRQPRRPEGGTAGPRYSGKRSRPPEERPGDAKAAGPKSSGPKGGHPTKPGPVPPASPRPAGPGPVGPIPEGPDPAGPTSIDSAAIDPAVLAPKMPVIPKASINKNGTGKGEATA
ncbi:Wzz/FepE/Etk N-terminal domain-containing protein [Actinomadura sp. 9N407]|uniref:Wzz/FepE/Etk N-terminal domain-containing protein n=1 Tax=Actinomadura sp. 9N407 TaxID=3375154 RepID=UPI0037AD0444